MSRTNKHAWKLYITFFLFTLCCMHSAHSGLTYSAKKKINLLTIHSFESTFPDYAKFNKLTAEYLKKGGINVANHILYLDCDAHDHDREIERIVQCLDTISNTPDIILVTDDQATYSLLASWHPLLKTIPIVFSGVNAPNWNLLKEYPNATGIWDNPDYEENIKMIEKLMGVKRIHFFYDKTYNGIKVIERLAQQYKNKDERLYKSLENFLQNRDSIVNQYSSKRYNQLLRNTDYDERPLQTSLYFINMWEIPAKELLWNISGSFKFSVFLLSKYNYFTANVGRLATVPTFSATSKGFGSHMDILGGYFTTLEHQVKATSDYILSIAKGIDIAQLPIKEIPKTHIIDWNVLNRWNISLDDIPAEFEVVNMPFYVRYHREALFLFIITVLFIITTIVFLLFLYHREVKRKRQAQMNLWEEKEFLSLTMEGSNIFSWKYSSTNNEFTFDKEFADTHGLASEKVKLEELNRMTHADDCELAINTLIKVANKIEERGNVKSRINFDGKGHVWYEFRFLNISGMLKNKSTVIGLIMDIQDYKDKEDELVAARDLASKAELKQSFLANMSHEIRTPLNSIVGFSNMLVSDEDSSDEEKQEYIHIINKNCELLLKLINDILELSRIESGNVSLTMELCDLNNIVTDVYNMCLPQNPPNVSFLKALPSQAVFIEGDALRLKQILVNFVNNAFKFTASGHVTIGIEIDSKQKEIGIYVEDTGQGIPEEHQQMIFERFYKVDEFAQGTGLGLSICQVIAHKMNGKITLASKENEGSRFTIVLPCTAKLDSTQAEESLQEALQEVACFDDATRPVILVAEDSAGSFMVLSKILKKSYNILWALNGADALKLIKKQKVDLVLMDIRMQKMDGITALAKIRRSHKKLPVIIQTAYDLEENRALAQQAGASGFIAKPITPEVLLKLVSELISANPS